MSNLFKTKHLVLSGFFIIILSVIFLGVINDIKIPKIEIPSIEMPSFFEKPPQKQYDSNCDIAKQYKNKYYEKHCKP